MNKVKAEPYGTFQGKVPHCAMTDDFQTQQKKEKETGLTRVVLFFLCCWPIGFAGQRLGNVSFALPSQCESKK